MEQGRTRYWTFIVYPESAPQNWRDILQKTGLQFAISPLHDKDINTTGEKKKEHFHVLAVWQNTTTYRSAHLLTEEIRATIPQRVMSPIGCIRYMSHKDNPEKAQYDERDITTINGLDLGDFNALTTSMVLEIKRAIINLARELKITEYSSMYDYLDENDLRDMIDVFSNHTMFFNAYFKSKHFRDYEERVLTNVKQNVKVKSR